jgi:hypothetical protein
MTNEKQKPITEEYRNNYDSIFKPKGTKTEEKIEPKKTKRKYKRKPYTAYGQSIQSIRMGMGD